VTGLQDRQLVDAVIAGDRDAYRTLVDREAGAVIGTCNRIIGDPGEAEDAAQEAFLQAYRALATYRGEAPFGAWLRRIAIRVAVARASAKPDAIRLDADPLDRRAAALAADDDPEAEAIDAEWRAGLVDAIGCLPEPQRRVILLRFFEDRSLQEIAALTGHPLGTVKSRLHRGLLGLREQIVLRSPQ
jgi:RNA polymerase sigma-70 factor (ECF subfamily)